MDKKMDKNVEKAIEIMKTLDRDTATGRYEVSDRIYYNVEEYDAQEEEKRRFEAHRRYADIQCILEGEEIIYVADASALELEEDFLEEKDIAFYRGSGIGTAHHLKQGEYIVLYPGEAHKPGVRAGANSRVKKAVFKVLLEE